MPLWLMVGWDLFITCLLDKFFATLPFLGVSVFGTRHCTCIRSFTLLKRKDSRNCISVSGGYIFHALRRCINAEISRKCIFCPVTNRISSTAGMGIQGVPKVQRIKFELVKLFAFIAITSIFCVLLPFNVAADGWATLPGTALDLPAGLCTCPLGQTRSRLEPREFSLRYRIAGMATIIEPPGLLC